MSGIYGYIMNPDRQENMPNIRKLGLWNSAYGNELFSEKRLSNASIGCYVEKLKKDAPKGSAVWEREGKIWAVDAVLYNRQELIELLKNSGWDDNQSKSISDEEIVISLIELKGFDVLAKINGDFAGAMYCISDNTTTLFRDHMGIRPLYYYVSESELCFSTDLRGILAMDFVDASILEEWIYNCYFDFIDYCDITTEYAKIFCVRPASTLKISFEGNTHKNVCIKKRRVRSLCNVWDRFRGEFECVDLSEHKYWNLGSKKIRYDSEEKYINQMRSLVEDAVRIRLDAFDGIAGAEFSGGLDSSLISILIHRMGRECKYISWSLDPSINPYQPKDERKIIDEICKNEGISCYYAGKDVDFSSGKRFNEKYASILNTDRNMPFYEKYAFWPQIGTNELFTSSEYIHNNGGKVVFTGHGGDEGVSHRTNAYELWQNAEYSNYFTHYEDLVGDRPLKRARALKRGLSALYYFEKKKNDKRRKLKKRVRGRDDEWQIINPDFLKKCRNIEPISLKFLESPKEYILNGGSRMRMDNVAMYGAFCDVRYMFPFLDYRLIDYAVSIERYMYIKHNNSRYILKQAFKDILPKSLLGRIEKSDPSFGGVEAKRVPLEKQVKQLKEKMTECSQNYDLSLINEIFSVKDILCEIEGKEVTEENYRELSDKCVQFFYAAEALIATQRSREN